MSLSQPSRTIVVEPVKRPAEAPPVPEPAAPPPAPAAPPEPVVSP